MLSTMIILSFTQFAQQSRILISGSWVRAPRWAHIPFFFFNMKVHGTPVPVLKFLSNNGI